MPSKETIKGREAVGKIFGKWDVIENFSETDENLDKLEGKPLIFAHNHFGLPDGPHGVGDSLRFKSIRNRDIELAVTHYLYVYVQFLNKRFKLNLGITAVVTPYIETKNEKFREEISR